MRWVNWIEDNKFMLSGGLIGSILYILGLGLKWGIVAKTLAFWQNLNVKFIQPCPGGDCPTLIISVLYPVVSFLSFMLGGLIIGWILDMTLNKE